MLYYAIISLNIVNGGGYNEWWKNIEIVNGNGDLNISPVTDYIEIEKPKPKITEEIVIPEEKKKI